jgi:hypothetical protein
LSILVISLAAAGKDPVWVSSYGADTGYDRSAYLTGYGIAPNEGKTADMLQAAREMSLRDLARKLKVSIEGSTRLTNSQYGDENFSSYQSDVKSMVALDLSGVEKYETAFDASQKKYVALAVLSKPSMLLYLDTQRDTLIARLDAKLKEVQDIASRKRLDLLQKSLADFDIQLDGLVQNVAIARILGEPLDPADKLGVYYQAKSSLAGALRASEILTIKDFVNALAGAFDWKAGGAKSVILVPAVYKTTDITGQFFAYVRDDLAEKLRKTSADLSVVAPSTDAKADLVLKGSYYEAKNGWYVVYKLSDLRTGDAVASWETTLDKSFVDAQSFEFLPKNIKFAVADHDRQVAVYDQPVATELKVWTTKGSEGLVFTEGERMYYYCQVNRPGYISVLYHLAGDKRLRVPLLENYRILPSQIGQPIRLEQEFEICAPFGSETAQFFFSPDSMPAFITGRANIAGETYDVLAEDYDGLLVKTRGVKKTSSTTDAASIKTDASLTVTTIPKR